MIAFIRKWSAKFLTSLIAFVRRSLTVATMFSFMVLFVLFFVYLIQGDFARAIMCLVAICVFIHLNKVL